MYRFGHLGAFKTAPAPAAAIHDGDLARLEALRAEGWDPDAEIPLSTSIAEIPLRLALIAGRNEIVEWLISGGASLNLPGKGVFPAAARYARPQVLRRLAAAGADVHAATKVGNDALAEAVHGQRWENVAVIDELGHSVADHGGPAFRQLVVDGPESALALFVERGVDIDHAEPDSVYPWGPTPVNAVARYGNLDRLRFLVAHGADVSITDRSGMRPYSTAVERGDDAMAEYLASVEPAELRSPQRAVELLRRFEVPADLVAFLQRDDRRIRLPESGFGELDFFSCTDVFEAELDDRKLLRLSRTTEDFTDVLIVWNPSSKKLAWFDQEHGEFADLASWPEFISAPDDWMATIHE
ncbi:Ankyrin repeat [Saccharopolyspora antimicrobica]|uniref:Ankyrin repeat n=1 Tax=Saccharopolyspora antimicrobica TaxID=455193 RepID=A0A1I5ETX3_9PSEU|nr:ankyrin repeat domain-containing protein [Saccharopolyspora antimicrobica]RKT83540.1 ankyrin repeat protein [Saccharopolyspora antimicrobica]SFO14826.1 Ankyrin repeat [Saccharopolyspora antimicrobica]